MAYNFEEQEQLDDLKAWWNKYGTFLMTVVTIVAVAVAGWRVWQWYESKQAVAAATAYEVVREAAAKGDVSRIKLASESLLNDYGSTVFAPMAALTAARAYFEKKDLDAAAGALRWIIDNAKDSEFYDVARLRLSAVLLDQEKPDDGLALLQDNVPDAFAGAFSDRRGDLLTAAGKKDEAKEAYKKALELLPPGSPQRRQIDLKLLSLN
ncbi:MAG: tetratricopeptide repeat protein [Burkholderiaceae bacterium]